MKDVLLDALMTGTTSIIYRNTYHVLYVTHALVGDPCCGLLCSLLIENILHICKVPLKDKH